MLPNKSNFVSTFEILGIILGGFEGYVIALTLISSSFDLGLLAGSLFFALIFGMFYGKLLDQVYVLEDTLHSIL